MSNFGPGLSLCRFTSQSALSHPPAQRPLTLTAAMSVAESPQHRTATKTVGVGAVRISQLPPGFGALLR
jgi:hypothetical protein